MDGSEGKSYLKAVKDSTINKNSVCDRDMGGGNLYIHIYVDYRVYVVGYV